MTPIFCYVAVVEPDIRSHSQLLDMVYVSIAMLRRLYPQADVRLFTDRATAEIVAELPYRLDEMAKIDVVCVDESLRGPAVRSRFLKTSLRSLVTGDLVFLDADALPLAHFDEVWEGGGDFAAALDRNREHPRPHFPQWVEPIYSQMGWQRTTRYYNSGVIFFADTPLARKTGKEWHRRWRAMYDTFGKHHDQPSLNSTVHDLRPRQRCLPLRYNAMIDASPSFVRGAKIVHYFLRGPERLADPESLLAYQVRHLQNNAELDWLAIDTAAKRNTAWVHPTNSVRFEWVAGNRFAAAAVFGSRTWRRLKKLCSQHDECDKTI